MNGNFEDDKFADISGNEGWMIPMMKITKIMKPRIDSRPNVYR
jgi:hypothetical protein